MKQTIGFCFRVDLLFQAKLLCILSDQFRKYLILYFVKRWYQIVIVTSPQHVRSIRSTIQCTYIQFLSFQNRSNIRKIYRRQMLYLSYLFTLWLLHWDFKLANCIRLMSCEKDSCRSTRTPLIMYCTILLLHYFKPSNLILILRPLFSLSLLTQEY